MRLNGLSILISAYDGKGHSHIHLQLLLYCNANTVPTWQGTLVVPLYFVSKSCDDGMCFRVTDLVFFWGQGVLMTHIASSMMIVFALHLCTRGFVKGVALAHLLLLSH